MDVCQSVMANFFQRVTAGQFDIETPEQLVKLLARMARNRLIDVVRKEQADKRDQGRTVGDDDGGLERVAGDDGTPSQAVMRDELVARIRSRLSADERELVDARAAGREWAEIAADRGRGETAEALRKQHARALKRVAGELNLDDLGPL
jgi:RNA polymerase sigma-70 factor (ECF subfamily)